MSVAVDAPVRPGSPWRQLSRYQLLVLLIAWLGWIFDSMDATIYNLVLTPALRELLGSGHETAGDIGWYGGIILAIFLVAWAIGGIVFGFVADRFGRSRTLVITILIYAIFTGFAGLAHNWWELAICRFLTALGIGGEWAAGATLVAEVWPESLRVKGAGLLASAWGAGYLLAAGIYRVMSGQSWRVMFFIGLVPALVAMLARLKVREPEKWQNAKNSRDAKPGFAELFTPAHRRDTLVASGLSFVAVFGLWGATNWTPSLVHELLAPRNLDSEALIKMVSYAVMSLNAGAIVGYLSFPFLAEWIGRRGAFLIMLAGSAVTLPAVFLLPASYQMFMLTVPVLGFFSNGMFGGFPIYFPELYPTRIRATGCGFCYNVGRVFAAGGPFITGYLVTALGTLARAASSMALVYVVGLIVLHFARETKGDVLQ